MRYADATFEEGVLVVMVVGDEGGGGGGEEPTAMVGRTDESEREGFSELPELRWGTIRTTADELTKVPAARSDRRRPLDPSEGGERGGADARGASGG